MIGQPRIFISAVSKELDSARQLVANTLQFLGYDAEWQDVFGADAGDLRAKLRERIKGCQGVVQLVGQCYGEESPVRADQVGRISYTQYEAIIALKQKKKIWYFLLEPEFPTDPHETEPAELRALQATYRENVRRSVDLFHSVTNSDGLKVKVHEMRDELAALRKGQRRWARSIVLLLLVIAALMLSFLIIDWGRNRDTWVSDQFVSVRVANPAVGTILGEEPYELKLELRNENTMPMMVTRIVVLSRSLQAAKLFGLNDSQVFKADIHIPYSLEGNETKSVPVRLNQILPEEIFVSIHHNQAATPSEFQLDLVGRALPMPSPRYLSRDDLFRSYDSLTAMKRAKEEAIRWSSDARLVSMFPGTHKVFIDADSNLKYIVVDGWVTTFYSRTLDEQYVATVTPEEVKGTKVKVSADDRENLPRKDPPEPVLGFEQALDLANRSSLLSADWNGPRFDVVPIASGVASAWFLPYRASDGLPVIIDAVTGDQLVNAGTEFRRVAVRAVPLK
jgi:Domain of unknown function (DUF4062)